MERRSLQTDEEIKEAVHNLILQDIYRAAAQGFITKEDFEYELKLVFGGDKNGDK